MAALLESRVIQRAVLRLRTADSLSVRTAGTPSLRQLFGQRNTTNGHRSWRLTTLIGADSR